jgi:NADPH:quinone reductase-like Zn-dependent oxidoreductase
VKRVLIRKPGDHRVLEVVEEPTPAVAAGQVRVQVRASGVNFADCIVRMGYYEAAKGLYPMSPGFEFSGIVDAVGHGVRGLREGDAVFGLTRFGGYASEIVVPADQLWPLPAGWSHSDGAAFPAVFLTAYYGLHRAARVFKDETVLVHSAAGGAGAAFAQLARIHGCRVAGVVGSASKRAYAEACGSDPVIVRSEGQMWPELERFAPHGFDAIFDANGVTTLQEGYRRLRPGGRLVCYGFAEILTRGATGPGLRSLVNYLRVPTFSPLKLTGDNKGVLGFNVIYLFDQMALAREAIDQILGWIAEGRIRKAPVSEFKLEDAAAAHAALESGTTQGKLVLTSGG